MNKFLYGYLLLIGCFLVLMHVASWEKFTGFLNINTLSPFFADLRTIEGAVLTIGEGGNPYTYNPHDPWERPMNYPPVWIFLFKFISLLFDPVLFLGFLQIVLVLIVFGVLYYRSRNPLALLIPFSPVLILLLERGNNDGIIFSLLVLSCFFLKEKFLGFMAGFLGFLKIYPVLMLGIMLDIKKLKGFTLGFLLSTPLLIYSFSYIPVIFSNTPYSFSHCFGLKVMPGMPLVSDIVHLGYFFWLVVFAMLVSGALLFFREAFFSAAMKIGEMHSRDIILLNACILIYTGIFILSGNWAYRLIFIAPVVVYFWNAGKSSRLLKLISVTGLLALFIPYIKYGWTLLPVLSFAFALLLLPVYLCYLSIAFKSFVRRAAG